MFRRDFNRLQAQRNQGFPKEPVSVKQETVPLEQESIQKPPAELDSQYLTVTNGSAVLRVGEGAATSDGLADLYLEQKSEFSNDDGPVDQVYL